MVLVINSWGILTHISIVEKFISKCQTKNRVDAGREIRKTVLTVLPSSKSYAFRRPSAVNKKYFFLHLLLHRFVSPWGRALLA